ncbi:uncharacterized protein Tco025E_10232 [Trypanosoma conorhini]|uniref:Uncharacterized protein n=1 Tax=Trypanosoma conorhini TaxID=83891 RepID=A0A3R7K6T3_9TRYP|nr:uncharacterized protein Tco025E_10232 [Trypanosoma conorhini]RNE95021.1 hypothetical protein Tco025E_10232 [Trypanosoma conorhini]
MAMVFPIVSLAIGLLLVFLMGCVAAYRTCIREMLAKRGQLQRLRDYPPAEPFAPPAPLPAIVDAAVVFTSHEEAQRHVEAGDAPITRVHSEQQMPCFCASPGRLGSPGAAAEGNVLPRAAPGAVMRGLPIDRGRGLPKVDADSCGLRHLPGTIYQLRAANVVYGEASYLPGSGGAASEEEGRPGAASQSPGEGQRP